MTNVERLAQIREWYDKGTDIYDVDGDFLFNYIDRQQAVVEAARNYVSLEPTDRFPWINKYNEVVKALAAMDAK